MRFSAWSFSEAARAAAAAASSAAVGPRGAVPLMGRASSSPLRLPRRKRSGEEQQICGWQNGNQGHGRGWHQETASRV